ncbi:MAG: hypothetical protein J1F17_06235 [Oscillospiraceae bacterium]|nr:hypothetical protein [Oscillospiraceae bacterium]
MNYANWAKDYEEDVRNLSNAIEKEKENLREAIRKEEIQSINRRIQILRSMYYECRLTVALLMERSKEKIA